MNMYEFIEALNANGFVEREAKQFHKRFFIVWVGYKQVVVIDNTRDIASIIETMTFSGELDFAPALSYIKSLRAKYVP